jgi:hypothetical protein
MDIPLDSARSPFYIHIIDRGGGHHYKPEPTMGSAYTTFQMYLGSADVDRIELNQNIRDGQDSRTLQSYPSKKKSRHLPTTTKPDFIAMRASSNLDVIKEEIEP